LLNLRRLLETVRVNATKQRLTKVHVVKVVVDLAGALELLVNRCSTFLPEKTKGVIIKK
jgi:hypothetical protein